MMRKISLLLVVMLLCAADAYGEHSDGCPSCHIEGAVLKLPIGELCQSCHGLQSSTLKHHPMDIPARLPSFSDLPSNSQEITCITCHEPHKSGLGEVGLQLPYNQLCNHCHSR